MIVVLDASVALKLIVNEPGHEAAQAALAREDEWIAPDWLMAEVASALAQKARFEGLSVVQARRALDAMPAFIDRFVDSAPFFPESLSLSVRLNHAFYDCLYLAVALRENATLLTADMKFINALRGTAEAAHAKLLS